MGTFDILNLRQNGYDFHVGLMAGNEKWTDAKIKAVFETWKELLPFYQEGAAGRTWQDAAQALVQKKAGMYLLGMFVSQQFQEAGAADLEDLDFFPYPNFGTEFDAEKALDAPIDGFMIAANSPSLGDDLDAAKAFMEYLAQPATQVAWVSQDPGNIAASKDADTSGYTAAPEEGRRTHRRRPADHPVPRSRHQPELRGTERHAGLPAPVHPEARPGPGCVPREDPGLLGHALALERTASLDCRDRG